MYEWKIYSIIKNMSEKMTQMNDRKNNNVNTENKEDVRGFELLAPAGSLEIFKAVIAAGADAVYVGGDLFGARAYANNFSEEELLEAIDYAHLFGRKVYLTVNTLLKNAELNRKLYDYLLPFYRRGLDAVLVQDMGVFSFIREYFPDLPIHTSTQMTITGVEGARMLQSLGAERIVMAREVSLAEIKEIYDQTGVELEAFVHGALCYCYSGQCLLSSMLGGRSGNRGRCAQPCRLAYSVLDENHNTYEKESFVLSLKDMCGIEDLNKLWEAGVYSLKIEGRMKQAPYAAGIVSFYRKYIDRFLAQKKKEKVPVEKQDMQDILALGNRCGFTDAYYSRQNGPDMVTFVKPSYEKTKQGLQEKIIKTYVTNPKKVPVTGVVSLSVGKPASYELTYRGETFRAEGMEVMEAQKKPLNEADVAQRMAKTGDTFFEVTDLKVHLGENVFLPNGALNQLRRDAFSMLQEKVLEPYYRCSEKAMGEEKPKALNNVRNAENELAVVCLTEKRELLSVLLQKEFVSAIYLDFAAYRKTRFMDELAEDVAKIKKAKKQLFFAMPRIFRNEIADWFVSLANDLQNLQLDGILVRGYEELAYCRQYLPECKMITDQNVYTYNDRAQQFFTEEGVWANTVPIELNRGEIMHRDNQKSEMIVYGYYPLMTSAQCVHKNTKGCDKCPTITYLKDRYQAQFPVKNYCSACYNVVYNSLPVMLFSNIRELQKAGLRTFRLDFTMESEKMTGNVMNLLEEFLYEDRRQYPEQWKEHYTNGHYKRGVE